VRAGSDRRVDELLCQVQRTVMVVPDLGNDEHLVAADAKSFDVEGGSGHVTLVRHDTTPFDSKRNAEIRHPALRKHSVTALRERGFTKNRKNPPPPAPSSFPPIAPARIAPA